MCDVIARMPELPRDVANLSIAYMGCSAMAKVVETCRWYLAVNPRKRVLAVFTEAITPLSPPLSGRYGHFSEVAPDRRQSTVDALHSFLFADASVAMVLAAHGKGPSFGPVKNLTNDVPEDTELGTVPDGGSDIPVVQAAHGRHLYTLGPDVTERGSHYAKQTIGAVLDDPSCTLGDPTQASVFFMHTGSTRILDALCEGFLIDRDSPAVAASYNVLRDYANTLGCSVPLMVAEPVRRAAWPGPGVRVRAVVQRRGVHHQHPGRRLDAVAEGGKPQPRAPEPPSPRGPGSGGGPPLPRLHPAPPIGRISQ